MGNKLPENIQQQCLKYGQDQKEILNLMDYLKNKGYQCQDIIGKGANGVVLRAFSQKLNRGVAIKCIKVEDKSFEKLKSEYDVIQKFKQASYLLQAFDSFQAYLESFKEVIKSNLLILVYQRIFPVKDILQICQGAQVLIIM